MGEGSTDNLMSSPLLVGSGTSGTSPNPQAGMLSPGASPPLGLYSLYINILILAMQLQKWTECISEMHSIEQAITESWIKKKTFCLTTS